MKTDWRELLNIPKTKKLTMAKVMDALEAKKRRVSSKPAATK